MPHELASYRPERRQDTRRHVISGDHARLELALPFPRGTTLAKDVIDISDTGLSFLLDKDEGYMLPGTPLHELRIVNGHRKFKTTGEVVYSNLVREGECYRIGVRFKTGLRKQSLALYRQMGYQLRPSRYSAKELDPLKLAVSLADGNNVLRGDTVNFSPYGLAVTVPLSSNYPIQRTTAEVIVHAGSRVIYDGHAVIAHLTPSPTFMLIGIELTDYPMDLEGGECEKHCAILASKAADIALQFDLQRSLLPEFRAEVADLRRFLELLKLTLDDIEPVSNITQSNRALLRDALVDVIEREAVHSINQSLKTITGFVKALGPKDHERYGKYFQDALHPLLLLSPFFSRAYRKPLGYAGDFEIINMILRNTDEGKTLFSRALSRQGCNLPVAKAHRNRIRYLALAIAQKIEDSVRVNKTPRITSIGCGPAREIVDYIGASNGDHPCEFTLVDFEPDALQHCQDSIAAARARSKSPATVTIINKSVRELIKDARRSISLPPQDLIYCGGLYDYLTFSTCCRLTAILYHSLAEGGRLIVSNVSTENEYRIFMEYGLEWFLHHRTPDELARMTQDLPLGIQANIDKDETGTNLFLNIVKISGNLADKC